MSQAPVKVYDYLSLFIVLLMMVAIIAGQAGASSDAEVSEELTQTAVVKEHFRGEDE